MASVESVTLEMPDPAGAEAFYAAAFGLDAAEEGHRPRHPARRGLRTVPGSRGRQGEQAVLRRPWPGRGEELRQQVRRVRHPASPVKLALYGRRAAAKDAGVSPDGTGSHRIIIGSDAGPFTDPDGFAWEAASA